MLVVTLMNCFALVSSPSVVCRFDSGPSGTISFNFSRQLRRWARRFFSSSLWVVLSDVISEISWVYPINYSFPPLGVLIRLSIIHSKHVPLNCLSKCHPPEHGQHLAPARVSARHHTRSLACTRQILVVHEVNKQDIVCVERRRGYGNGGALPSLSLFVHPVRAMSNQ